jgi:hypothetical protein
MHLGIAEILADQDNHSRCHSANRQSASGALLGWKPPENFVKLKNRKLGITNFKLP